MPETVEVSEDKTYLDFVEKACSFEVNAHNITVTAGFSIPIEAN